MPRWTKVVVAPRDPGVEHRHIGAETAYETERPRPVAAVTVGRISQGRQIAPAGAAGGFGIGRDHLHPRLHQVEPVVDVLGIALAHQEDDRRGVRRTIERQARLPVGGDQSALGDGVDVIGQSQGDHVRLKPIHDRPRLLAGAVVRLPYLDIAAAAPLPVRSKQTVVILVKLTRRVIAYIEQGHRAGGAGDDGSDQGRGAGPSHDASPRIVADHASPHTSPSAK